MKRRNFLKMGTASLVGASALSSTIFTRALANADKAELTPAFNIRNNVTSHWLGEALWGNRLQDWRVHDGRIECLQGGKYFEVRTASILTHQLSDKAAYAHLRVKLGTLTTNKTGFAGFLLGAGGAELDYRGASLTQRAAGENGGIMAVVNEKGELSVRDFSNADKPFSYQHFNAKNLTKLGQFSKKALALDVEIVPNGKHFDLVLTLTEAASGREINKIAVTQVKKELLVGNILLVSSPDTKKVGARWWFSDVAMSGSKIKHDKQQTLGPVVGCMHSVNKDNLRLSTQLMPVAATEISELTLQVKQTGQSTWVTAQTSPVEDGFVTIFDIAKWQYQVDHDYRIVNPKAPKQTLYQGTVSKDPGNSKTLKIALHSCLTATAKNLDDGAYKARIKEERVLGRYSKDNIQFPHTDLVQNCEKHQPDLYLFVGDQFYEGTPTRIWRGKPDSKLDLLYRWYLWYWTHREQLKHRPAILLADDHDVLQGNLWGVGGRDPVITETGKRMEEDGGYMETKSLVQMAYRIQHSHNPAPYDPTPIDHDIPVTYGAFVYGGTSFAVIEDRKFKSRRNIKVDPRYVQGELLGQRQEIFLREWKDMDKGLPKVVITASMYGSAQTRGDLIPLLDYDSNGYPHDGRTRAVKLIKDAKAVVLAGDQHIAMLAKQGINDHTDGPLFFAGPAGAAFWQRWFEGEGQLANQRNNDPNTGDFEDTFGNKMRVLAVANPKVSYKIFKSQVGDSWSNFLSDRRLKSEGYGLVKVDHQAQQFHFECWEFDVDPTTGKQFDGWPYSHNFE
ncbi:alkaline phosphatase D family protein [Thalassotalea agarivorans]|uniref:Alkaline phosphatase D n=1 Tax=Thalassotalea agarivorans TaxID=349064 RepID=A0A1I0E199_THASX|nr:alkaline phosphatase D family protein [Thalassotalea agarivorans]SET38096.1 alkaline phosphatase D [Thalassotalea agarivorans]